MIARRKRQEILIRDDPPALWVIIDEPVLNRPVGGRHVMLEQISRLVETAKQPSVRIEVIETSVGAYEGLYGGSFIVADFDDKPSIGYVETPIRGQPLKERKDVASLDLTWATLTGEALPRAGSLALLEEAAKSWSSAT